MKALLALALIPLVSASPPSTGSPDDPRVIVKVVCPKILGMSLGSAVRVGPNILVSVNHVTNHGPCTIDSLPVKVLYAAPDSDFSIISVDSAGPYLKPDCGGFIAGRAYQAIGHARGLDQLTTVDLTATGNLSGYLSVLKGIFTAIPGQSGGGMIDTETRNITGVVNSYDMPAGLTGSVELKGTPICRS